MSIRRFAAYPFTLRQLQYAVAVAETLSFRKAAERCHVSQPSLSVQLAQMERDLGVRVFERDRRGVLLTSAGQELVRRARQVLLEADDVIAAARRAADPLAGTLRVGVIPTISPYLLPSATPALRAAYPALTTLWVENKTDALVRDLEAGTLDAALVALEADLGDVEHDIIAVDPFVLATSADDPLGANASAAKPTELRDAEVLLLEDGHCLRQQALAVCSHVKATEMEFRATSLTTLAQMVAAGAGVTLLPRIAVATESARARLRVRAFAEPAPHRTIALIWRRRSALAASLRQVAATIRGAYPGLEPGASARNQAQNSSTARSYRAR